MKSYRLYVTASTCVYHHAHLVKLLLVRYSNACLRLFVVILPDLHCLHRSYHNVDHSLLAYQFPHIVELLLVRYSIACLRLFVVILQDLHCLHRSYCNVDHWGVKLYRHTDSIFSGAFVREIQ